MPKSPRIILISGLKRSGKDYVASELAKHLDCDIIAFADPIKTILANTLQMSVQVFDEYKNSDTELVILHEDGDLSNVCSFRELIQNFSTDAMKPMFGDDVWSQRMLDSIENSSKEYIIIPDLRYDAEFEDIADHWGNSMFTINVQNRNIQNTDTHCSENGLRDFEYDFVIDNTNHDIENPIKYLINKFKAL